MVTEGRDVRLMRFGGVSGIIGPVVTLIMVFAAVLVSPWFKWDTNALSDLGVSEAALIFNSALIIGGVFNFFFVLGLRVYLPRTSLTSIGTVIVIGGGASLALIGIFTEDLSTVHTIVSFGFFLLLPVGLLLIGMGTWGGRMSLLTIATGIAALFSILALPIVLGGLEVGFAVPEIIEALILSAWIVVMAARLLQSKGAASPA